MCISSDVIRDETLARAVVTPLEGFHDKDEAVVGLPLKKPASQSMDLNLFHQSREDSMAINHLQHHSSQAIIKFTRHH